MRVSGQGAATPVGFQRDVIPVFTRAGCNAGTCHGASRGQDGFRLSLFGFDPAGDHFRLTREMAARRIHLAIAGRQPDAAKGHRFRAPHGGRCLEPGSPPLSGRCDNGSRRVRPFDADCPPVSSCRCIHRRSILVGAGTQQRLVIVAAYSDGSQRDVTDLAVVRSSDESVAAWRRGGASGRRRPRRVVRHGEFRGAHRGRARDCSSSEDQAEPPRDRDRPAHRSTGLREAEEAATRCGSALFGCRIPSAKHDRYDRSAADPRRIRRLPG